MSASRRCRDAQASSPLALGRRPIRPPLSEAAGTVEVARKRDLPIHRRLVHAVTRPAGWLEDVAVVLAALLATAHAEWRMLSDHLVVQTDAKIHEYWMRRFQDPALFDDPLTEALLATGYSPPGFRLVYWLGSHVVDPVFLGELLPLVLQPLAVWLVFRIVRAHSPWRPAAWIASALFLVPWDIHRFSGGHPRAFAQPIVLLAVFLLLSRRNLLAALVPPLGVLLYPPAGALALAILFLASLERERRFFVDRSRFGWAAASAAVLAAAVIVPRLLTGVAGDLITAAQARAYPEFGASGQMHFFASSTLGYLKQNYSGFALRDSGSILAVATLLLLVARLRNATLLRWEVWCMPIAALALFGAAHALLFHLYLPHRYTYSLIPFFCIAIAVALRPTLEALAGRARLGLLLAPVLPFGAALVALTLFPLGPQLSLDEVGAWLESALPYLGVAVVAAAVVALVSWKRPAENAALRAAAAAGILAAAILIGEVSYAGGGESPAATSCRNTSLYAHLRTLPKDAIVAGDPVDVDCIPIAARRAVVISRKLYQPWEPEYFEMIRDRMFWTIRAYYGPSVPALAELRERYGADYVVVRLRKREQPWPRMAPFTDELRRLLRSVDIPAALRLPERCRTWRSTRFAVYDLACSATRSS
jgi:hypothetical protein